MPLKTLTQTHTKNKKMKKITILAIFLISHMFTKSQVFDGIPISGKYIDCVNKYKAKGYILKDDDEIGATMEGKIGAETIELIILKTPKTSTVYKATIYLPKKTSWKQLKTSYTNYLALLVGKYGDYDKSGDFFSDPYEEGDGYEMSAVSLDKCNYYAYWENKNNTNIYIEISKYTQVKIAYENVTNMKLKDIEKEQIQRSVF